MGSWIQGSEGPDGEFQWEILSFNFGNSDKS